MGRIAKPIIFRNKLYASVKEAARLNHYSESGIYKAIQKERRGTYAKRKATQSTT